MLAVFRLALWTVRGNDHLDETSLRSVDIYVPKKLLVSKEFVLYA